MNFKTLLKPFASLRLTVVLLALSMIVVFAGTWAQIDDGIWQVQRKYFHSFFCIVDFNIFLPRQTPDLSGYSRPVAAITELLINMFSKLRFPMLGGYSLIILLLLNLLAAHTVRFKINRKRVGIILIHSGLILLILGEVITSLFAVESQMTIQEGETVSFASDIRSVELAVVDKSAPDHDTCVAIAAGLLKTQADITNANLPFDIHIDRFFTNTSALGPFQAQSRKDEALATAGKGVGVVPVEVPQFSGTEADRINQPSAFVTLSHAGQKIGTYLVSIMQLPSPMPDIDSPQEVKLGDKTYQIQLRFVRHYKPYSIQLLKFSFDKFTGTNVARNYSSRVRIIDPEQAADREVLIWMNHPLRFRGETFYQADFNKATERGTVLQVVHNPGWMIPYISCAMVALGMVIHFGMVLLAFLKRQMAPVDPAVAKTQAAKGKASAGSRATPRPRAGLLWPAIAAGLCVIYLLSTASPDRQKGNFDLAGFGRVPVSYEGRVMPLDSLARNSLRIISGRSDLEVNGQTQPATWWLLNAMAKSEQAEDFPVVRIDLPEILSQLKLDANRKRFSIKEIMQHRDVLGRQGDLAFHVDAKKRDLYQRKVLELIEHINLFYHLTQVDELFLAPPVQAGDDWKTVGVALDDGKNDESKINPGVRSVWTMLRAYDQGNSEIFNTTAADYANWLEARAPQTASKINFEMIFNHAQPFMNAMVLYVLIFLLVCLSWMFWRPQLQCTAFWILIVTLCFHTLGLIARIYIQGRPPVTNLYSSAIFIAWAVGVMCVGLELIYRNSIGTLMASVMGFLSLIVAHNLSGTGDTMQMMQAVLDTNFWLATHVVVITLGYSATFLAGFLAIAYLVTGLFTNQLRADGGKTLYRMVYGILCFAMLFSFVGTILGGIWADQSWGRFWGWDPKENGAVLIVFWNALILHARWGGLVKARGVMLLAVFGNAVTSWSWFGTNMLGVGLHSYGFMDSAVFWLALFVLLQLGLIVIGSLPLRMWRSFQEAEKSSPGAFPAAAGATML